MSLYILENKTTSEDLAPGSPYWARLQFDPQISLYHNAAETLGYKPNGVLYNVIRKPQHRPHKEETAEAYGERVLRVMLEEHERYFARGIVVRLEDERNEAALDVWQTAGNIREAKRLKIWPRNVDSCMQWSRQCEYLKICSGETDTEDRLLYTIKPKKNLELSSDEDLLTQSAIRTYRACARRYYYRYELLLRASVSDAEPLRTGKSIHRALETWWETGDVELALTKLDDSDSYMRAKESAMVLAHHVRWEAPEGVVGVEQEWICALKNPQTGAVSRTFKLGGRFDGLVELENGKV